MPAAPFVYEDGPVPPEPVSSVMEAAMVSVVPLLSKVSVAPEP